MKFTMIVATVCGFLLASCANSLEKIADESHRQRIDAANANQSLSSGAADGLGSYIAQSREADNTQHP